MIIQENNDVTLTAAVTGPPRDFDQWAGPLNRPLADVLRGLTERPKIYSELGSPAHRAMLCGESAWLLAEEPDLDAFAFGGKLLERIRTRAASAGADEQAQLRRVEEILSEHGGSLMDLCITLRRRGHMIGGLRALHHALGEFLAHVDDATRRIGARHE